MRFNVLLFELPWYALVAGSALISAHAQVTAPVGNASSPLNILTNRYNQSRTAANVNETQLTPANVNTNSFGNVGVYSVDGVVFAQPLYVQNLTVNGATHNVLFIGTMHDVMYAFDADNPGSAPLWKLDFRNASAGIAADPVYPSLNPSSEPTVGDTLGIFGTPVIDLPNNRMFFVTQTLESGTEYLRLRNVNILTGALNGSTQITAAVPASGSYAAQTFLTPKYCQRPALELVNGQIWIAFGSRPPGDYTTPYQGWVMTYSATSLTQTGVYVTSRTNGNSIWQSGAGPAVDGSGNVYYLTGNGGIYSPGVDLPNSLLQLSFGSSLTLNNWYTPDMLSNSGSNNANYMYMNQNDLDLAVDGPMLIPGTNLITFGGKTPNVWLMNTKNLGQLTANDTQVLQFLTAGSDQAALNNDGDRIVGMAFWPQSSGGTLFVWPGKDALHTYSLNPATSKYTQTFAGNFVLGGEPSTALSVSANGTTNGIVWAPVIPPAGTSRFVGTPGTLHAYSAANPGTELWNSDLVQSDHLGSLGKFVIPVVANGRVYYANSASAANFSAGSVIVYGLRTGTAAQTISFPPVTTQNSGVSLTLTATASSGLAVSQYVSSTPSVCTTAQSIVSLLGAGTCSITAYQAGNVKYAAATPVSQSFPVNFVSPPNGTVVCAGDGATCVVPSGATSTVFYGAGSSYHLVQNVTGSITCNQSRFGGDPDPGVTKSCYELVTTLPSGSAVCATDGGTCTVPASSTATIYYGASGNYFFIQGATGALGCSVSTFGGDPDSGLQKSCYEVTNPINSTVLSNAVPSGSVVCASENATCAVPLGATATVYYGATGNYFFKSGITGSLSCNNNTFTDPDSGIVKACYALVTALPSSTVTCSGEGGTCQLLSGATTAVYFGVNGKYTYQAAVNGVVSCANASFAGDPDYGLFKTCSAISSAVAKGTVLKSNELPATAVLCANDNGICNIPAGETASVFYGANSSYTFKQGITGSIACNINVLGPDPAPGSAKACYANTTLAQVPLVFNVDGIMTNGADPINGGLDVDSYAYSANLLGSTAVWSGIPFTFGPANTVDVAANSTLPLPPGNFPTLYLLAAGVNGAQVNQAFTIAYTDGTTSTVVQSLSDWAIPSTFNGETAVVVMPYRISPNGSQNSGSFHVYGYSLPLNPTKTVKSIMLPNNRNVVVLAITL